MRGARVWIATAAVCLGLASAVFARAGAAEAEPGLYHRIVMKGHLLEVSDEGIYLCVGKRDGAEAGQQLDVYRYTRDFTRNPKQGAHFRRERVGRLEVTEIVDAHYARAKALEGGLQKGDVAELEENGG